MGTIDAEQFDSFPSFKSIGQTCSATGHLLHCDVELFGFQNFVVPERGRRLCESLRTSLLHKG
jgi:hypothetical protein